MTNLRMTSARKAVLELLHDREWHQTASEIHEALVDRLPSLNLSTVYRSLDYLIEHGVVSVADVGRGSPVYEAVSGQPHHHLVCLNCNHIFHVDHSLVAPFFDTLRTEKKFSIRTNHLVLYGICENCQIQE